MRWNDLRHTGATLAAVAGATLNETMDRIGHSTPNAALMYRHASEQRQPEIAARLSALATTRCPSDRVHPDVATRPPRAVCGSLHPWHPC